MEKEENWRMNVAGNIKGRIAEAIVEQLFKRSGMEVYFFGIEWWQTRDPNKKEFELNIESGEITVDRNEFTKPPDFLLITGDGYLYEYVEVKFRKNGGLFINAPEDRRKNDIDFFQSLQKNNNPHLKVLWVSQDSMEVVVYPYIDEYFDLMIESIEDQDSWNVKPEVLEECLKYLKLYSFFFQEEG
jgi:hypothetical protein